MSSLPLSSSSSSSTMILFGCGLILLMGGIYFVKREYPLVVAGMKKRNEMAGLKIVPILFPLAAAIITLSGINLMYVSVYYQDYYIIAAGEEGTSTTTTLLSCTVATFVASMVPCLPTMHSGNSPQTLLLLLATDIVAMITILRSSTTSITTSNPDDIKAGMLLMIASTFALVNTISSTHRTITTITDCNAKAKLEKEKEKKATSDASGSNLFLMVVYGFSAIIHPVLVVCYGAGAVQRMMTTTVVPSSSEEGAVSTTTQSWFLIPSLIVGIIMGLVVGAEDSKRIGRMSRFLMAPIIDTFILTILSLYG